ncbi:hypothetical protein RF11_04947 [Thelohanellus kitauei]|uniref:Uncharacterized protein n=1 Tax=Thelohanellus kitauei TaxID=669202 RepID=A0A0C2MFY9_THEKT|nr:hypothetical protein RF11_04947 [Thelohanellus kitauei]
MSIDKMRFEEIHFFLNQFISALSDHEYNQKLLNDQKLFLYEDLSDNLLSVINTDFKNNILSQCEMRLYHQFPTMVSDSVYVNNEYQLYQRIMTWIVMLFNQQNTLSEQTAKYFSNLCDSNTNDSLPDDLTFDRITSLATRVSLNMESNSNIFYRSQIDILLRLFMLIYELKYIYGGISSKFPNLTL